MNKTYPIDKEQDTILLAERIAPFLRKGDVLALYGDLGSGKTFFTNHLCKALGVTETVTSPSFVLMNQYEAPHFTIYHIDLYRMQDEREVWGLGLEEFLEEGLTIIEWPQIAESLLVNTALRLTFLYSKGSRTVTLETKKEFEFTFPKID